MRKTANRIEKTSSQRHDRMLALAGGLRQWIRQEVDGAVYWLERTGSRRGLDRVTLAASPIDVGESLRQELFQSKMIRSVVMTSATLATGTDDKFKFFRSRIGLSGGLSIRVGSPFDYQQQAKLVVVRDLPDPSQQRAEFEKSIPESNQTLCRSYGRSRLCAVHQLRSAAALRRIADRLAGRARFGNCTARPESKTGLSCLTRSVAIRAACCLEPIVFGRASTCRARR